MKYTHNAVQMCIASMEYDEKDYIRNYADFK
ncbi:FdtA/QdtA family cupin domain-containing protein [Flavobacterium sp. J372]|nr:FdtA/QdtA family cupin domain-containing protein [Flavobacterium sp. J372]